MSRIITGLCFVVAVAALSFNFSSATAEEKKAEVTKLTGTITCAKCDLGVAKACATVIVVEDKDKKKVTYYFDKDSHKKNHPATCQAPKEGTVTGTISKDGDHEVITVKSLEYKK